MKTMKIRWVFLGIDICTGIVGSLLLIGGVYLFKGESLHWLTILSIGGALTCFFLLTHFLFFSFGVIPSLNYSIQMIKGAGGADDFAPSTSRIYELKELTQLLSSNAKYCKELAHISYELLEKGGNHKIPLRAQNDKLGQAIQNLARTLGLTEALLERITQGNLLMNIPESLRNTVLGEIIRAMLIETRQSIAKVRKEIKHISIVSANIAAMSQQGSRNAVTETQAIERISSSIHQVAENLQEVIQQINLQTDSLDDTFTAIEQMLMSIQEINEGIESLSAAADVTSYAISEIHDLTREIEAQAQSSAQISETVANEGKEGVQAVGAVIEGIYAIKDTVENAETAIQRLGHESERIGEILKVINEIAEQTNLLALNASIIAAQAGEHGRGFSVVANEIKELAERTRTSTQEIAEIIQSVRSEVSQGMTEMHRCLQAVDDGVVLANQSGTVLKKIVQSIQTVQEMVSTMAEAIVTQTENSQRVKDSTARVTEKLEHLYKTVKTQAKESTQLAEVMNFLKQITQHIGQSSITQLEQTDAIVHAIEEIQKLVQRNANMAHQLADSFEELGKLESNLAGNMGQFLVTKHQLPADFDPEQPTIAFVYPSSPFFFKNIFQGIRNVSLAKHVQAIDLSSRDNPVIQAEYINWLLRQSWLKGIVLAPVEEHTGSGAAANVVKHGIPIAVVDRPAQNAHILVLSDNKQGGEYAAEILREKLSGEATVLVSGSRTINSIFNRMEGFFTKATSYHWRVVEVFTPTLNIKQAKQSIMEGVRSNPDAEGIFLTNEDASLAYLELLHDEKLPTRKIYAVGYDIGPAIIQGISDGHLLGTIFQDPARLGSIAVQELLTLLKQPQLDVPVKSKEILVPVKKITRDNLPTPL